MKGGLLQNGRPVASPDYMPSSQGVLETEDPAFSRAVLSIFQLVKSWDPPEIPTLHTGTTCKSPGGKAHKPPTSWITLGHSGGMIAKEEGWSCQSQGREGAPFEVTGIVNMASFPFPVQRWYSPLWVVT